jgi:outer membrane protein TolC
VVAVAALSLAIGLNVNAPTSIVDTSDVPPFTQSLAECLQTAVGQRREFQVARESIQVADEGRRVAKAIWTSWRRATLDLAASVRRLRHWSRSKRR